jgi:hypothetical protein
LLGDLNVNATSKSYPINEVVKYFKDNLHEIPNFKPVNNNEYDLLMFIFNHNSDGKYFLRDTLYEEHKIFKVTYGDCHFQNDESVSPSVR